MTNEIAIFNFGENEVRTVIKDGEPWFVVNDVCSVLGVGNITKTLSRLDEDEFTTSKVADSKKRLQDTYIVNEAGLYSIVLTSRKPEAKAFKRWITHEVIPTIRKTGGYVANEDSFVETYLPFADESMQQLFRSTLETVRQQNKLIHEQQTTIAVQAPKVEAYDSFLSAENTMTITEVGKIFGLSGIKLYEFLRYQGVLLQCPNNAPAQEYLKRGYFKVIPNLVRNENGNGSPVNIRQTRVSAAGVDFIYNLLKRKGLFN